MKILTAGNAYNVIISITNNTRRGGTSIPANLVITSFVGTNYETFLSYDTQTIAFNSNETKVITYTITIPSSATETEMGNVLVSVQSPAGEQLANGIAYFSVELPKVCSPGSTKCEGYNLYTCRSDGTGWYLQESNSPSCGYQAPVCSPGETYCANNTGTMYACDDDGLGWHWLCDDAPACGFVPDIPTCTPPEYLHWSVAQGYYCAIPEPGDW